LKFGHFFNFVPFEIAVVQTEKINYTLSVQVIVMLGFDRHWAANFLDDDFLMSHGSLIIR